MDNLEKNSAGVNMTEQMKLSYFMDLEYDIILRKSSGSYYLYIQELSLIVCDENLDTAYNKLQVEKEQLFIRMIKADAEDSINLPRLKSLKSSMFSDIPSFIVKVLIVFTICAGLFGTIVIGMLPIAKSIWPW